MQLFRIPGGMIDADAHFSRGPQITNLIVKEASINVSAKYINFADIFPLTLGLTTMLSN